MEPLVNFFKITNKLVLRRTQLLVNESYVVNYYNLYRKINDENWISFEEDYLSLSAVLTDVSIKKKCIFNPYMVDQLNKAAKR